MHRLSIWLSLVLFPYLLSAQAEDFVKAEYTSGDFEQQLAEQIKYPMDALQEGIEGDVILSLKITELGTLDSLSVVLSPNPLLAKAAINALAQVKGNWSPTQISGINATYNYLVILRFRRFMDAAPPQYDQKLEKLISKQKWEKALKVVDQWLDEDAYNSLVWSQRSRILKELGDDETETALEKAKNLSREFIANVPIVAIGKTRKSTIRTSTRRYD